MAFELQCSGITGKPTCVINGNLLRLRAEVVKVHLIDIDYVQVFYDIDTNEIALKAATIETEQARKLHKSGAGSTRQLPCSALIAKHCIPNNTEYSVAKIKDMIVLTPIRRAKP